MIGMRRMTIRILSGDPGSHPDPFAFVGLEASPHRISVKLAKQFVKLPFYKVAKAIRPIYDRIKPDVFIMETNNKGKRAIDTFRRQGMDVKGVATCGELTDKNRSNRMDKNYTIGHMQDIMELIHFPSNPSPTMQELEYQIKHIKGYRTLNGSMTYRASRGHDDLFMALLLGLHIVRCRWEHE